MIRGLMLWICILGSFATDARAQGAGPAARREPIVIAHRGASGFLPEHTEGAKILAVAQGADFIEQDVVLSRDKVFVVCHDITLHETTDVAKVFPGRKRADGAYYVADFDWKEILQLSVIERLQRSGTQAFPGRFPGGFHQRLMRLEDEIAMIQGLSRTLNRPIGIYVELKRPSWHQENMQVDMAADLLKLLTKSGYDSKDDNCFIQCFEHPTLRHLKVDLKCELPLIALMGGPPKASASTGPQSENVAAREQSWNPLMGEIAEYAVGIGPSLEAVAAKRGKRIESTGLVEAAHHVGLLVHPYTIRADGLPKWCGSIDELHDFLFRTLKVDGVFTDFPLLTVQAKRELVK